MKIQTETKIAVDTFVTTWGEFVAENRDDLGNEIETIKQCLETDGCFMAGGGAAPEILISVIPVMDL